MHARSNDLRIGEWVHVAWVHLENGGCDVFVNGSREEFTAGTILTMGSSLSCLRIGSTFDGLKYEACMDVLHYSYLIHTLCQVRLWSRFCGYISELRLWSSRRNPEEIRSFYNRRAIGTEPCLISCYHLNEVCLYFFGICIWGVE